jgi:hypothetical protein
MAELGSPAEVLIVGGGVAAPAGLVDLDVRPETIDAPSVGR